MVWPVPHVTLCVQVLAHSLAAELAAAQEAKDAPEQPKTPQGARLAQQANMRASSASAVDTRSLATISEAGAAAGAAAKDAGTIVLVSVGVGASLSTCALRPRSAAISQTSLSVVRARAQPGVPSEAQHTTPPHLLFGTLNGGGAGARSNAHRADCCPTLAAPSLPQVTSLEPRVLCSAQWRSSTKRPCGAWRASQAHCTALTATLPPTAQRPLMPP